jgi:hypothetical protein
MHFCSFGQRLWRYGAFASEQACSVIGKFTTGTKCKLLGEYFVASKSFISFFFI